MYLFFMHLKQIYENMYLDDRSIKNVNEIDAEN